MKGDLLDVNVELIPASNIEIRLVKPFQIFTQLEIHGIPFFKEGIDVLLMFNCLSENENRCVKRKKYCLKIF